MPESSPSTFCAFGVPLILESDPDNSTAGQAGPRAGVPVPSASTGLRPKLALGATGEQTSTTTVEVKTTRGGNVGTAAGIWRQTVAGSSVEVYRGADLPVTVQAFASLTWDQSGSQVCPQAINLTDGGQMVVYAQRIGAGDWNVRSRTYDPDTDTWASAVLVVSGLYDSSLPWPYLLALPDGRILCFYWQVDPDTLYASIDISVTSDQGVTWTTYAEGVLDSTIGITGSGATVEHVLNRMAVGLVSGQMVLFYHLTGDAAETGDPADSRETMWQNASADYGATFSEIGHIAGAGYPAVNVIDVTCYVGWIVADGTATNATTALAVVNPWTLVDSANAESGGVTAAVEDGFGGGAQTLSDANFTMLNVGGYLWSYGLTKVGLRTRSYAARIDPSTFTYTIWSLGYDWWYDGQSTSSEWPESFYGVSFRGQTRIFCNFNSTLTTYDEKIAVLDLGGYSSVTVPRTVVGYGSAVYDYYWMLWEKNYVPSGVPSLYGWTHTGAGTQNVTTTPGWLRNATAANTSYDSITPSVAAGEGIVVLLRVKQVSGGSVSTTAIGANVRVSDVATQYQAALQVSSTQLRIVDVFGVVNLGTAAVSTTAGADVLIAVNFGKVSAWARVAGSDWDRKWTTIINGGTLTDGGALGTDLIEFGNITAGTATSEWQVVNYVSGSDLGTGSALADGFTNPDDLHAFLYTIAPSYVAANVSVSARMGPGFPGDTYTIYPFAEYALSYALPRGSTASRVEVQGGLRPSPQVETRSIPTASMGLTALWRWKYVTSGDRYLPPIVLLQVEGLNVESASVRTHVSGGISTARGTLDMTYGATGLAFFRDGNTIRCDTGTASSTNPFFEPNMLAGGYVVFNTGGKIRPIETNSAGNWTNAGTGQPPTITITGDDTEPSSGTINIIWPRATFVLYTDGSVACEGFELYWSSPPATYEGYIKVGAVAWCEGVALYDTPSWGNVRDQAPSGEVYSSQWGADRPRQVATPRRIVELPFVSTYSDQRLRGNPSAVGERVYFKATSSASYPPVAASSDTANKLMGIWNIANGAAVPVVYCDRLARGTPNSYTLTGFTAGFLGTIRTVPHFAATSGREGGGIYSQDWTGGQWQIVELR